MMVHDFLYGGTNLIIWCYELYIWRYGIKYIWWHELYIRRYFTKDIMVKIFSWFRKNDFKLCDTKKCFFLY